MLALCCYPAGRGLRIPSRRQVESTELELDDWCCYSTRRSLCLPSSIQADALRWS